MVAYRGPPRENGMTASVEPGPRRQRTCVRSTQMDPANRGSDPRPGRLPGVGDRWPNGGKRDAVVVGAGPNGLAAAITLAGAGRSVIVLEAAPTVGGGCRTAELTLPGFLHDVCSAVHPLARSSPVFAAINLERFGVRWIEPPIQLGHPFDDGSVALVYRDLDRTAAGLGADGDAYRTLLRPLAQDWGRFVDELLGPLRIPRSAGGALRMARFGIRAVQPTALLARRFRSPAARALLAGVSAHSTLQFGEPMSGTFGLVLLGSAHGAGWPMIAGGSQVLADALAAHLGELGGEIVTGRRVVDLDGLPDHRAVLLDLVPRGVLATGSSRFAGSLRGRLYAAQLRRYRHGPGVFKLDLALDGPVPWRNPDLLGAGTVHLGGTLEEIGASEALVRAGRIPRRPFVILGQPSLFDPSRVPAGRHSIWAYCHVPNGSGVDMTGAILGQVERFAPGVRDRILAIHAMGPGALEEHDANDVGGDIGGGIQDITQFFTRPAVRLDPYSTPDRSVFVCSSATPPGGGVHGLCGSFAAASALRGVLR